jgi:hypothetical protein
MTVYYTLQLAQTESVFRVHVVWVEIQPFVLQLEQAPAPVFLLKYVGIVSRKQMVTQIPVAFPVVCSMALAERNYRFFQCLSKHSQLGAVTSKHSQKKALIFFRDKYGYVRI